MREIIAQPETQALIATFSLAWFLVGWAAGRVRPAKARPAVGGGVSRNGRQGRGPEGAGGGGSRRNGRGAERKEDRALSEREKAELYVGNLPYEMSEADLNKLFSKFGRVVSIRLIENRVNGKSKGFGFIEMGDAAAAEGAIKELNATKLQGRAIVVSTAKSHARRDG